MKAISKSNSKEIKHENDLDFSVYVVIRLFSIIDFLRKFELLHDYINKVACAGSLNLG